MHMSVSVLFKICLKLCKLKLIFRNVGSRGKKKTSAERLNNRTTQKATQQYYNTKEY